MGQQQDSVTFLWLTRNYVISGSEGIATSPIDRRYPVGWDFKSQESNLNLQQLISDKI